MIFIHPKDGKFTVDGDTSSGYKSITGTLSSIKLEQDPGNGGKISPYEALIVMLTDDENMYRIKCNVDRNWSFSLAAQLPNVNKGDAIKMSAVGGDDPTVTFCNIQRQDESGEWKPVGKVEMPADRVAKITKIREIVNVHPAKREPANAGNTDGGKA